MTTPTNAISRDSGSPKSARMRANAASGASRSSSVSVSQIPRKIPVISSTEMPRRFIAPSIRSAADEITPDSASWS